MFHVKHFNRILYIIKFNSQSSISIIKKDNVINHNNVNSTSENDNNDGKTSGTSFKTLTKVLHMILKHNDGKIEIMISVNVNLNEFMEL